jgi:thioredoxin reductase (NADPH)
MYDVIVIGSGPAGLSAAVYAKRAQLDLLVIEKEYEGTGQIAESERVDNYLGLYGQNGYEMGEIFRNHAVSLGASFYEGEVESITANDTGYTIKLSNDDKIFETKTIIYAAGASHRHLGVKGEEEFAGRGVSYCAVCDGAFYKDKTVAVVGGGDTALGDAVFLAKVAKKVYLIHRRDEFRANKTIQKKVFETENIECVMNAVPDEIVGDKKVSGIIVTQNGIKKTLETDGVFVAVGNIPNSKVVENIVKLDKNGYIESQEDGITSAKGIFAAGDVRTKKLRQVITAASDGANCVTSVEEYLG